MHKVVIVGAGIAGLSAALRLVERGYDVTLYEQDDFIGGMLRSYVDPKTKARREHSYHMFMNWYYNTWKIVDEIGARDNFTPRESFKFLYEGRLKDMPELVNPGGPQDMIRNLQSGAAPAPELFLFMYSMIDLLAQPLHRDRFLDKYSVNGFLASRLYATEGMADLHQKVWETVWAISSYQASAMSYKNFLKYGNRVPVPQLWLLKGNKYDTFLKPLIERILELHGGGKGKFRFEKLHELAEIVPDGKGRVRKLVFNEVDRSPSIYEDYRVTKPGIEVNVANADVIIAITPGGMADLVKPDIYNADPKLGGIRYLRSEPMASVELHLTKVLKGIPKEVTVFMDTDYQMTFLDYSQLWPDQKDTFLYITVSDFQSLLALEPERRDPKTNEVILDLENPKTAIDYILREVKKNLEFETGDINRKLTTLQPNDGEDLFANMVGSWDYRPETATGLNNLYLAGTYVRNFADVSTIEGAVVSGLNAAEAVRAKRGQGAKIEVIYPDYYPESLFMALKVAWAPYAAAAKAWSMANGLSQGKMSGGGAPFFAGASNPSHYRDRPRSEADLGSLFWDFLPKSLWDEGGKGLGPMFWGYGPDGRKR